MSDICMKPASLNLQLLKALNAEINALRIAVKNTANELDGIDLSYFSEGLEDIYGNDFLPLLNREEEEARNRPSTRFSDRFDYFARTLKRR